MKFGTTFAAARHPTWRCIDYDMLKAMIKRGCSTADFLVALSNEVILVDMHFMQLRETMRVADSVIDPAALRSHAVINYVALLKIIKKATRRLGGGHTALTKQQEKGWSHLLQSSFCQCLLLSSVFIETSPRTATMVDDDGVDSPSSGRDNGEQPANCPVCLQVVSLLRLECGHGACEACLAHCASAGLKSCPLCRAPSTLDPACRLIEALPGHLCPKVPAGGVPRRVRRRVRRWGGGCKHRLAGLALRECHGPCAGQRQGGAPEDARHCYRRLPARRAPVVGHSAHRCDP